MMVADTGPLIAFARLGRLPLLHQVVEDVIVPEAVYDELVTKGRGKAGAAEIAQASWIRREAIQHRDALAHFPATLAHGEREAIILAEAIHAMLLMDDGRAREVAEQRGVRSWGVCGSLAKPSDADSSQPSAL